MQDIAIILVSLGLVILIYALLPAAAICSSVKVHKAAWKSLFLLIVFFIIGYLSFITYLINSSNTSLVELIVSMIFIAGAVFVVLVAKLSLKSLLHVHDVALKLLHQSTHDSLTSLANRHRFKQWIDELDEKSSQRKQQAYSVLLMDLDKFKLVNDLLGHHIGDLLLVEASNRLKALTSEQVLLSRLGGDEFAMIVRGYTRSQLRCLAKNIEECICLPFIIENRRVNVGVSIGIASFPYDGSDGGTLLKRADIAMYQAKRLKIGFMLYDEKFEQELELVDYQIKALKEAVDSKQLFLRYQAIVDSDSGQVSAVEALARWTLEDGSQVSPSEFIAMAQANNLMHKLTDFVLNEALSQLSIWQKDNIFINMHVNLSATDFQDIKLVSKVMGFIKLHDIDPQYLTLEITESALLEDISVTNVNIELLRDIGVSVAIDDFGMAFSSLNYLRMLNINHLKLDYEFVHKILTHEKDLAIVEFSINLAKKLNCIVTAEGIESEQLHDKLAALGCEQLQGFWICEPLESEEFTHWLMQQNQPLAMDVD